MYIENIWLTQVRDIHLLFNLTATVFAELCSISQIILVILLPVFGCILVLYNRNLKTIQKLRNSSTEDRKNIDILQKDYERLLKKTNNIHNRYKQVLLNWKEAKNGVWIYNSTNNTIRFDNLLESITGISDTNYEFELTEFFNKIGSIGKIGVFKNFVKHLNYRIQFFSQKVTINGRDILFVGSIAKRNIYDEVVEIVGTYVDVSIRDKDSEYIKDTNRVITQYANGLRKIKSKYWVGKNSDLDKTLFKAENSDIYIKEERLALIMNSSKIGAWDLDVVSGHISIDHDFELLLDIADISDQLDLNSWYSLIHPDDIDYVEIGLYNYIIGNSLEYKQSYRIQLNSDNWRWIEIHARATEIDEAGNPVTIIGIIKDITEYKKQTEKIKLQNRELQKAQNRLKHSNNVLKEMNRTISNKNESLELALSCGLLGFWEWDVIAGNVLFDDRFINIMGNFSHQISVPIFSLYQYIHREDVGYVKEQFENISLGIIQEIHLQFRIKNSASNWLWIDCHAKLIEYSENNIPSRIVGVNQNITESKVFQKRLLENEYKYKKLIETASDRISLSSEGDLELANTAYYRTLGYTCDEIEKADDQRIIHPDDRSKYVAYKEELQSNQQAEITIRLKHKDGNYLTFQTKSVIFTLDNQEKILSVSRDISDLHTIRNELFKAKERLEDYSRNLEHKVMERTLELKQKNRKLNQAFKDLKSAQSIVVHSEKMAALGQLIAGVAHEINTPIGAIHSSASMINGSINSILENYSVLHRLLNEDQIKQLELLIKHYNTKSHIIPIKEKRKNQTKISKSLQLFDVSDAEAIAKVLADVGYSQLVEEDVDLLLYHPQAREVFVRISKLLVLKKAVKIIHTGAEKAIKVVTALKNYSRLGRSDAKQYADLIEGIETVLILYDNKIKNKVSIKKQFDPIPPLFCYPDELNQVWNNLIQNSLYAMDYKGELDLNVYKKNKKIVIEVKDSGSGIPNSIYDKVFNPFFTTKPSDSGTGIGLDIVKKIIDKHDGNINFDSKEGQGTCFRVELPIVFEN